MGEENGEEKTKNPFDTVQRDGVEVDFPEVCETPAPGGPAPLPYPNVASSADTSTGAKTVKTDGKETIVKGASYTTSTGDEPGRGSRVSAIDTIKHVVTIKTLGIPLWLWGVIVVGGAVIIWILASNAMPPIQPYEPS
jgi:hypothetical protein